VPEPAYFVRHILVGRRGRPRAGGPARRCFVVARSSDVSPPRCRRGPLASIVTRVPGTRLDAEKLRMLEQWAAGLQGDSRVEVAAAGRAILMLVEEVERLNVLVWDRQLPLAGPAPAAYDEGTEQAEDFGANLRQRLGSRRPHFGPF